MADKFDHFQHIEFWPAGEGDKPEGKSAKLEADDSYPDHCAYKGELDGGHVYLRFFFANIPDLIRIALHAEKWHGRLEGMEPGPDGQYSLDLRTEIMKALNEKVQ